jgi:hypothetical protein
MRHLSRLAFPILVLSVALAAPALAPAPALAANCGGAVPCSCGDYLVASRTLVPGVDPITTTVCTGDGLTVDSAVGPPAPDITLDLGGSTIQGDGLSASTAGVHVTSYEGLTVTRGTITGFGRGIQGDGTGGSTFSGLDLLRNVDHGMVLVSDLAGGNTVTGVVVARMACGAAGIEVTGDSNILRLNRVEYSKFDGTTPAGIITNGKGNTISRNIVRRNSKCDTTPVAGFNITAPNDGLAAPNGGLVELNRSEYNDGDGYIIEGDGVKVSRNIALTNRPDGNGITVSATSSGNQFERNSSRYNARFGIEDSSSGTGTKGTANTYKSNGCTGNGLGKSSPAGLC